MFDKQCCRLNHLIERLLSRTFSSWSPTCHSFLRISGITIIIHHLAGDFSCLRLRLFCELPPLPGHKNCTKWDFFKVKVLKLLCLDRFLLLLVCVCWSVCRFTSVHRERNSSHVVKLFLYSASEQTQCLETTSLLKTKVPHLGDLKTCRTITEPLLHSFWKQILNL